jgi:hypothetical protein
MDVAEIRLGLAVFMIGLVVMTNGLAQMTNGLVEVNTQAMDAQVMDANPTTGNLHLHHG